jgi:hypothetical protein
MDLRGTRNERGSCRRKKGSCFSAAKDVAEIMGKKINEISWRLGSELDTQVSVMRRYAEEMESCCKGTKAMEIFCKIGDIYGSCGFFSLAGAYYRRAEKWESAGSAFMQSGDFMLAGKMFSAAGNGGMAKKAFVMAGKHAESNGEICHAKRAYEHAGRSLKVMELDHKIRIEEVKVAAIAKAKEEERLRKRRLGLCK